jgi:two-component system, sensor histidine kinase and response regulator
MLKNFWDYFSHLGAARSQGLPGRLVTFNRLNILAIFATVIRLFLILLYEHLSVLSVCINLIPAVVCAFNIFLSHKHRFGLARFFGFYILPSSVVLVGTLENDYGISLFTLLLAVISFFFLEKKSSILLSFIFSTLCFFILRFSEMTWNGGLLADGRWWLTIFNHLVISVFVYFILHFIKTEIVSYQQLLFRKNKLLWKKNKEVRLQRIEISRQNKAIEEQRRELMESDQMKTRLLSVISHDLRVPLVSVKNIFDLYEKQVIDGPSMLGFVPELNNEVMGVLDLLENLLLWSKQQTGQVPYCPEPVRLDEVIRSVTRLYVLAAGSKNIMIESHLDDDTAILADKQMVKMILRNFISNAIKFTPAGGKISISHEVCDGELFIRVADNGMGMDEAHVKKVLRGEMFSTDGTGNEKGSGIGLGLCHQFIIENQGRLHIESQPGRGSSFAFVVPAVTMIKKGDHILHKAPVYRMFEKKEGGFDWKDLFSQPAANTSGRTH